MKIKEKNALTEYARLKIKINILKMIFSLLGLSLAIFGTTQMIDLLLKLRAGEIETSEPTFLNSIFYTFTVLFLLIAIGLIAYLVVLILSTMKQRRIIKYYKEPRFSVIEQVTLEYDYKLWQVVKKNSYHSISLFIPIDGEIKKTKSHIIFTNSKKAGPFSIPKVLQSHSYVKNDTLVGYDPKKDEIIVLSIIEK